MNQSRRNIMPNKVDWGTHVDPLPEPARTMVAEHIVRTLRDSGAMCVDVHTLDPAWLGEICHRLGMPTMLILDAFSPESGDAQKVAWEQARKNLKKWQPKYMFINHEANTKTFPQTVEDAYAMACEEGCGTVQIRTFCGEYHFPHSRSDTPCPEFYKIWDDRRWPNTFTPVERIRSYRFHYPERWNIKGGYPWLCPFTDAWDLTSPLVPMADWVSACEYLADNEASGISQYQTYGGKVGPLDDPRHDLLAEYSRAASGIFS